jgi:CDP-6-deoxy-D-xylo-4-hexulose-3-dehydrase
MKKAGFQYPLASSSWDDLEVGAMQRVIETGEFTMGQEVSRFETDFANYFGSKYAVMVNSGSSANLIALAAMRYSSFFRDGKDEIIVPAVSWSTTYYPIHQLGFKLKFVDVDLQTLNASPHVISDAVNERTAGIFAVNLLGNPSQLSEIRAVADQAGIFLLEDNCESMGATLGTAFAGTFGQIGTFSTFFSHHISTMEGGVCVTDNLELAQLMISLRAHGWTRQLPKENLVFNKTGDSFKDSFNFVVPGYNLRPLELSGAIGQEQLKKLDGIIDQRRTNALLFNELALPDEILKQQETGKSSWFGFSLILTGGLEGRRADLVAHLEKFGVETRPIVAGNFTKNPVMKHLNFVPIEDLPNADFIDANGLFVGNNHIDISKELRLLEDSLQKFS